jgi:CheY-like chemotaxis protein
VIVLDLKMPGCDGYEFRERQPAHPGLARIPTVIFTADAEVDHADVVSLREVPIVKKSAELAQLLAAVERATG